MDASPWSFPDYVTNPAQTAFVSQTIIAADAGVGSIVDPLTGIVEGGEFGPNNTGTSPRILTQSGLKVGISSINDGQPDDGTVKLYNVLYNLAYPTAVGYWENYGSAVEFKPFGNPSSLPVETEATFPVYSIYENGTLTRTIGETIGSNFPLFPYPTGGPSGDQLKIIPLRWALGLA